MFVTTFISCFSLFVTFEGGQMFVRPHLPLDVLQHVFVSLQEVKMLELRIISFRLHQAALLDVHHFTETVWRSGKINLTKRYKDCRKIMKKRRNTHTCWVVERSSPCCCVWSTLAEPPWRSVPGRRRENLSRSENQSPNIKSLNPNKPFILWKWCTNQLYCQLITILTSNQKNR